MNTLAHKYLEIESDIFNITKKDYHSLELLIEKSKKININDKPLNIISNIGNLLLDEGFKATPKSGSYLEDVFCLKLRKKEIDCKDYVVLYCSFAEILNLPLNIVIAPGHFFINWKSKLNWETTRNEVWSNQDYINYFKIPQKTIDNGVFFKEIRPKGIACRSL